MLKSVLFLAAYTLRSRAYSQAMAKAGYLPEYALLYGREAPPPVSGEKVVSQELTGNGIFVPDFSATLEETCRGHGWNYDKTDERDVNAPEIVKFIQARQVSLIIFSGYGGQIVKKPLLDLGIPILHIHSGWLPRYRGSTTLYYSWLSEGRCGVTAFLLDEGIDTGALIMRGWYPVPTQNIDPDTVYDHVIRADMLIKVLEKFTAEGSFTPIEDASPGETFYVIHPVLKHMARVSEKGSRSDNEKNI